jgi:hypothetical protein
MNTPRFSLTEDQWDLLMVTLLTDAEDSAKSGYKGDREVARRLTTIIHKLIAYRRDTNQ